MATNTVILYFDSDEDAVRFTVAAGAVMAGENNRSQTDVVQRVKRASRIAAKGTVGTEPAHAEN
jgi:hypothetical protein